MLPSITVPRGVPPWRLSPHDFTLGVPYATVEFCAGHTRKRRTSTGVTRTAAVELLLREVKAPVFHDWFEDELRSGSYPFAAHLLAPDGRREWWAAYFVGAPQWTHIKSARGSVWQVTATLRLEGEPE